MARMNWPAPFFQANRVWGPVQAQEPGPTGALVY